MTGWSNVMLILAFNGFKVLTAFLLYYIISSC